MKHLTVAAILSLLFSGCNQGWDLQKRLNDIKAIPKTESFEAILNEDTLVNDEIKGKITSVHIDSNGRLQSIATDSSIPRFTWPPPQINDSTLIYCSYEDTTINFYYLKGHRRKILFHGRGDIVVSNDKNYVAFNNGIYVITKDSLILVAKNVHYAIYRPFSDGMFIGIMSDFPRNGIPYIFKPDFTIYDSLPYNKISIQIYSVREDEHGKSIFVSLNSLNVVAIYDTLTRKTDTLFSDMYFSQVEPLSHNYYLIAGKTKSEFDHEDRRELKSWKEGRKKGEYRDFGPQQGYWMIGNSITKKIKKIGYEDYSITLSSSGRHILFYKWERDGYHMKVVSVKELIDGM